MSFKEYDVVIIGGGTAGIFAGYELAENKPDLKILLLEQGNTISRRDCPIVSGKTPECIRCKSCSIMNGFGGAGAFSDGKFNFTTSFGGWLNEYIPDKELMQLFEYVDNVNVRFGATTERFTTDSPEARIIEKRALQHDLHLMQASVKHLGTENNQRILSDIFDYLNDRFEFRFNYMVKEIISENGSFRIITGDDKEIACRYLVNAPGRSGAEWFTHQCQKLGLNMISNQVDIGVRVELPARVFEHITDVVYESKLMYRTKQYGDIVRTFCMNPNGYVVAENVDNIITVNGHSYGDPALCSENTNFALLVSNRFTQPFNEPHQYGKRIASLSNMLGGGVLVQRFGVEAEPGSAQRAIAFDTPREMTTR
ncbi:MAG: FAD-dependent oxidoreductase [Clostridiales bacterium]|nr:FAD-dependent oxidoreductase [Clostridiales bacterium]